MKYLEEEKVAAKEAARETEALLRTWESLVSRGQQVPAVSSSFYDVAGFGVERSDSTIFAITHAMFITTRGKILKNSI